MKKRTRAIIIPPGVVTLAQASVVGEGFMGVNFLEDFANVGNKGKRVKFPGVLETLAPGARPKETLGSPGYRFPSKGRGWHCEPYRHSLAARGIKTHPMMERSIKRDPAFWAEKEYWLMTQRDFDDVDLDFEIELIEATRDTWVRLWKQRDRDLNILKHSIDKQLVDRYIDQYPSMNIVFHADRDYYCVGSGDIGGGKVFWLPYTHVEGEKVIGEFPSLDCDNVRVLAHELSHAFGSHTELVDDWNDLVAYVVHIEHGSINPGMLNELDTMGTRVIWHRHDKRKAKYVRNAIASMRYLYKTYGDEFMDQVLLMSGYRLPEDLKFIKEGLRLE